jgi:hypothetical protein
LQCTLPNLLSDRLQVSEHFGGGVEGHERFLRQTHLDLIEIAQGISNVERSILLSAAATHAGQSSFSGAGGIARR